MTTIVTNPSTSIVEIKKYKIMKDSQILILEFFKLEDIIIPKLPLIEKLYLIQEFQVNVFWNNSKPLLTTRFKNTTLAVYYDNRIKTKDVDEINNLKLEIL